MSTPTSTFLLCPIAAHATAAGQKLKPQGTIAMPAVLFWALALCLLAAVALIVAIVLLSRPRRRKAAPRPQGAHITGNGLSPWRARIQAIVDSHEHGAISRDDALAQLAEVARDFASQQTGRDLSAHTLSDIGHEPSTTANAHGIALLRQTLSALYPPEFADEAINATARQTSVAQAGEWVSTLIERWRR
ncbi:hypothetical protein PT282_03130 [Bifidobacterium sp. ESL0763]|uniref:hypothetical protein n=1 Tax=Bifidobacterium sp. ESL0763 TaxID=2983227 RepID=UPI0023F8E8C6|nr:hypothetical protein [Bifidobacterium sp. ESL0763]MDF7663661.1 hypothetical protein [Bifidobacterium sp. ESL0763]